MPGQRLEMCSLTLLLFQTAIGSGAELMAHCGSAAGCFDSPDPSLHLLQQHALHLDAAAGRAEAAATTSHPSHSASHISTTRSPAHSSHTHRRHPQSESLNVTEVIDEDEDPNNPLGLSLNSEGDLTAFGSALVTNVATMVFSIGLFMMLRVHYPLMYSGNVVKKNHTAPSKPDVTKHFSWISASMSANTEAWIQHVGLDNAMLLEFSQLSIKILLAAGLPMCLIMAPIHYLYGGKVAGSDHMSYFSVGNVKKGSWIYFAHAFVVWYVVVVVIHFVFTAQLGFVHKRFEWLKHQADIRAKTVLVSGISKKKQSDDELKGFFEQMFPGGNRIQEAYVAKDTRHLVSLVANWKAAKKGLYEAQQTEKETGTPVMRRDSIVLGQLVPAALYFKGKMQQAWEQMQQERKEILEASKTPGAEGYNCCNGFVTFTNRADAEIALRLDAISKDQDKWDIQSPPEPKDLLWTDLTQDPMGEKGRAIMGYLLLLGLFLGYVPLVIGLTHVAEAVDLGPMQPFWAALAPTFGLNFMICFLPTFLDMIDKCCFTLMAAAHAQRKLQIWYFWFQVFFVILIAAIGKNVTQFLQALVDSPLAIFRFLGESMPNATHFYMNFMVLQWATHCMNTLRYTNLFKFLSFRALYSEEEAADMAEPEAQDYYGLGSRNARWTINLITGLVYGSLCPPMYVLTFVNFLVCRVIYGYLIPFAETRKPDTGGHLWVTSLSCIFAGLVVYIMLMTGVLYDRASSNIASWIAAASLIYVWHAKRVFDVHYAWERLPFKYVVQKKEALREEPKRTLQGHYRQPELYDDYEVIKKYMEGEGMEASS